MHACQTWLVLGVAGCIGSHLLEILDERWEIEFYLRRAPAA